MTQFYDPRQWGNVRGMCGRIGGRNKSLLQEQMGVVWYTAGKKFLAETTNTTVRTQLIQ